MTPLLGLVALVSCASLEPSELAASRIGAGDSSTSVADRAGPDGVRSCDGLTLGELAQVDVRGTATSTQVALDEVRALTPERRAEVAEALLFLQVTCPYNRASVQLPLALRAVVSQTDPADLHRLIQSDWAQLQKGLDAHVALLDALDADLPMPVDGDFLYGRIYPGGLLTREELSSSTNPVTATLPLLASIPFVVDQYDEVTRGAIAANLSLLEGATVQQWPLREQMIGWRTALERMQPFVEDEARKIQVEEMIRALDEYAGREC